jgi:hypothetical protein
VVVYRPVARFTDQMGAKMSRGKKTGTEKDGEANFTGRGKSPVEQVSVSADLEKKGGA